MEECCTPEKKKPRLYLSDKDLPEIKDFKVGATYKVTVEMTVNSLTISDRDGEKTCNADFEVKSIKSLGKKDRGYDKTLSDLS